MDLTEIGYEAVRCIRLTGCCEHCNIPSDAIKGGVFLHYLINVGGTRRTLLCEVVKFINLKVFSSSLCTFHGFLS
jgi:hypothetical protein